MIRVLLMDAFSFISLVEKDMVSKFIYSVEKIRGIYKNLSVPIVVSTVPYLKRKKNFG